MHSEALGLGEAVVLAKLRDVINKHGFTLAGGTGLSLRMGHRLSDDLDFFTEGNFSPLDLFKEVVDQGCHSTVINEAEGTLEVNTEGVRLTFLQYPYPFVEKAEHFEGVPVAGILDIASMKVMTIIQRGARRDFVDLYSILQNLPFGDVAKNLIARYGSDRINPILIGKALTYFEDAEHEPEPRYIGGHDVPWDAVKGYFDNHVRSMVGVLDELQRGNAPERGMSI